MILLLLLEQNESEQKKKRVRKKCSTDGCTNIAVKGRVCYRHGAKVKTAAVEDATNQAKKDYQYIIYMFCVHVFFYWKIDLCFFSSA